MTEHNTKEHPQSRAKNASKAFTYGLFTAIIVCIIGIFLYLRQMGPGLDIFSEQKGTSTSLSNVQDSASQPTSSPKQPVESGAGVNESTQKTPGPSEILPEKSSLPGDGQQSAATDEYQHHINELNAFYSHLDQQPYMDAFGLKEPSKIHFSKLLQKLVDNPPVVTRETDDLFTILKNTAHFFRILNKENITILKGILDREKQSFEQILKTFYALTYHPEDLKEEYSLNIPPDALYDYAGFFLNTIGGRLYLFRRDSASRMTVSYYSILVIDRANSDGNSRHGIDLRPSIDSLIEEIENTGKNLKFKEEYLDKLYDLKEKYN